MRKIVAILFGMFLCVPYAHAVMLIEDTEIESVVTNIISPVTNAAGVAPSRMRLYIVQDDDFNAFVMGGEDIYLYTGLLSQIRSPNALRAVVAHELGHMLGGHIAQMSAMMESEMRRAMFIQALGVGLMLAGGNPSMGAGVMAGASGIAKQSVLSFSRDEERMADDMGVNLMCRAEFNPNGFLEVFDQMNEKTAHLESKLNPNAINHPLTSERLKNVRDRLESKEIKQQTFNVDSPDTVAQYDLVRAKLVGYLDDFGRVKALYPYSDKSSPAIYARAIANMRSGNLDGAMVGIKTLISRDAKNPFFYELLGDLEFKYGHYDAAVIAYERALELRPESPQIKAALALVLTERGRASDKARAIKLCKDGILKSPKPIMYWILARAYESNDGRADWAMAEYYNAQNQRDKATEYARRAKTRLKIGSPEYIKSNDILNQK